MTFAPALVQIQFGDQLIDVLVYVSRDDHLAAAITAHVMFVATAQRLARQAKE